MTEETRGPGKFPTAYYNWISIFGAYVASVAVLLIILFLGISFFFDFASNPYLGIVQFLILPGLMVLGLILIPLGAWLHRRRMRKSGVEDRRRWPRIDFNQRSHRNAAAIFAFGSIIVIFVSAVGSYQTFHYTESVEFCGKTCHDVMLPEYTAYQNSPHARVACVACHIGPGAGWWVKSKLSGAYQVYAVIVDNYPKPIPTPVSNLRPAQETCEQCHWPEKFFGSQQKSFQHYMYDENNTSWPINMLIKTGGADPSSGMAHGIHWHMNIQNKIEYIARDEKRQDIPWVRVTDRTTNRVSVYTNTDNPLTEEEIAAAEPRVMDCIDCHNRPSHIYNSPDHEVDMLLVSGRADSSLPDIKRIAVEAMAKVYETTEEAKAGIATRLSDYYEKQHPDIYQAKKESIDHSIEAVQYSFTQNIFPEMKARWDAYPSNLGHFISPGCFRCHNSSMVNETGNAVNTDCTACHLIIEQGSGDRAQVSPATKGLEFEHPEDIDEAWREMGCFECHSGTQP